MENKFFKKCIVYAEDLIQVKNLIMETGMYCAGEKN